MDDGILRQETDVRVRDIMALWRENATDLDPDVPDDYEFEINWGDAAIWTPELDEDS